MAATFSMPAAPLFVMRRLSAALEGDESPQAQAYLVELDRAIELAMHSAILRGSIRYIHDGKHLRVWHNDIRLATIYAPTNMRKRWRLYSSAMNKRGEAPIDRMTLDAMKEWIESNVEKIVRPPSDPAADLL